MRRKMVGGTQDICFLLNGAQRRVTVPSATMTLLDWLRGPGGLTGAKEGCREGDCGACTVVLGEAVADETGTQRLRLRAVNACLVFLPMVDGRLVLTVEALAEGGDLHPVQAALVEHHGSQCGFCTPGMVMSLFAHHQAGRDAAELHDTLAGNLCRCTGYRPILDAARAGTASTRFTALEREWLARLGTLRRARPLTVSADDGQTFHAPYRLDDLLELRRDLPHAHLVAGGTDLGLLVTRQFQALGTVIAVDRVPELQIIAQTADSLILGAAVSYEDALPALERLHPAVAGLVRRIGSRQIRNLGTLGGNIVNASPIGDSLPPLLVLDATVRLRSAQGMRDMALADFLTGYRRTALAPDEILERITIPRPPPHAHLAVYKIARRYDQDISTVSAAFLLTVHDGVVAGLRAAYGGMAATARRVPALEAALAGRPWSMDGVAAALPALAQAFAPLSDVRGSADYRMMVAGNLLQRFFLATTRPGLALEVMAL